MTAHPAPAGSIRPATWAGEMGCRMRHHLLLKTLGITAFMWLFFLAYFYLLRHPARPVTVMPLTWLDRAIPYQPGALAAYVSLWLYVGVPAGLALTLREAANYGLWAGGLCLTGLAIFYVWPSAVPLPDITPDLARDPAFVLLQGVDAGGNACPSLHVATATLAAFWLHRLLRVTAAPRTVLVLNWFWLALIVHATVAIRQHVVLDVLAGALLALPFAWLALRRSPPTGHASSNGPGR
jgi:membrane-associated phospholipid phosphatase